MFKQTLRVLVSRSNLSVSVPSLRAFSSEPARVRSSREWDLVSAVCLERHPVVVKPMSAPESRFDKMLKEIEYQNSMKSDHELRLETERTELELQKKGLLDVDLDIVIKQSAQDLEDSGEAELAAFQLAPRVTKADKENRRNTMERKLDRCLVLLVEQKVGSESFWLPPLSTKVEGESMRQAAERALREVCGKELKTRIYGNAPVGFYKYAYPKTMRENGRYGAKVFYYLAKYLDGDVPETVKHQWLDRRELLETLPPAMHKSVTMFLVAE